VLVLQDIKNLANWAWNGTPLPAAPGTPLPPAADERIL